MPLPYPTTPSPASLSSSPQAGREGAPLHLYQSLQSPQRALGMHRTSEQIFPELRDLMGTPDAASSARLAFRGLGTGRNAPDMGSPCSVLLGLSAGPRKHYRIATFRTTEFWVLRGPTCPQIFPRCLTLLAQEIFKSNFWEPDLWFSKGFGGKN